MADQPGKKSQRSWRGTRRNSLSFEAENIIKEIWAHGDENDHDEDEDDEHDIKKFSSNSI